MLCWDIAKYVNHSFNPSCMTTAYDFEIAIRDIQPGEQLTDDYGYLNIAEPFMAEDEGTERKVVYPDDILRYHAVWDQLIQDNLQNIAVAAQPLQKFIPAMQWAEFSQVIRGYKPLRSVLSCHYEQPPINRAG